MEVYLVAKITEINNSDKYNKYTELARPIIEKFGGEYVINSTKVENLKGGENPEKILILKFPSKEKYQECFSSDEYKEIVSLRLESTKSEAYLVEK